MTTPSPIDRIRIAAVATCCERTVTRAYQGASIASTTRARINAAAVQLGLPMVPEPANSATAA